MAKAALNMMTLTGARDYARDGILMNSADTGKREKEGMCGVCVCVRVCACEYECLCFCLEKYSVVF
jgi:hypothetical protein